MKYLIVISLFFISKFGSVSTIPNPYHIKDNNNQFDTLVRKIAIQSDTDAYLMYLFKNQFSCQMPPFTPNSVFYNDTFIDTCFDLAPDDINYLKNKAAVKSFYLYSKYFKKHIPRFKSAKTKRNFNGFKFSIYTCRIIVSKGNNEKRNCNLPNKTKYLSQLKEAIFLKSVKLIRD